MSSFHLIFREAKDIEELLPLLRLRYSIYLNERKVTRQFLKLNSLNIDIDFFDLNARHFGLYHTHNEMESLIGCCRIVYGSENQFDLKDLLLGFTKKHNEVYQHIKNIPTHPMYFLEINNGAGITKFYNQCKNKNLALSEVSRICIFKEFRNLKNLIFLIRSVTSAHLSDGITNIGIASTSISNSKLYKRFSNMVPISDSQYIIGKEKCIVLMVQRELIKPNNLIIFDQMGEQLNNRGEIHSINYNR